MFYSSRSPELKPQQLMKFEALLSQRLGDQTVSDFLLQYDNSLFFFVSELMDLLLTGEDQSQADQPNNLAEGHPM